MKLGSLFDGSGGFPLAGVLNCIQPVWASEIEPFPIRVTKARFPRMKHLGSVTDIDGGKIEPVDVITFGSPCQDLSVAGKQAGLHEGERSSLFFEAIRIIKEMRDGTADEFPRFAVWENVPGAFSSNRGEDFRAVLEALCNVRCGAHISIPMPPKGKWLSSGCVVGNGFSVAWRTYDAQYWGVPQRRKRIYLVADFGSERAGEILFEREGLRGDSSEGGEAGESASGDAERGVGGSGGIGFAWANSCHAGLSAGRTVPTLKSCRNGEAAVAFSVQELDGKSDAICYPEKARSLLARHDSSPCVDRGMEVVTIDRRNMRGNRELSGTIQAKGNGGQSLNYINPVCYDARGNGDGRTVPTLTGDHENRVTDYTALSVARCRSMSEYHIDGTTSTLKARDYKGSTVDIVLEKKPPRKYIVRRLTPTECARLQGFPDWWTDGVEGSDSAKYKMWGNGIALPCAEDVMRRIKRTYERMDNTP